MSEIETLSAMVNEKMGSLIQKSHIALDELTVEVLPQHLCEVCLLLRDSSKFAFEQLIDVCGVDYLHYGIDEWETESATEKGFERGIEVVSFEEKVAKRFLEQQRYGVTYHLLSVSKNHRIRIKVPVDSFHPAVPSVVSIWPSANWFEREAFDLYGIHFTGHPDLRRLLTDYGFIGYPFRKDFPLIGTVEARYDATAKQVIYGPVSIEPRILEPKVIRDDNRYKVGE